MGDSPIEIIDRLSRYVDELIDARKENREKAISGRTSMILNALDKLRKAHKNSKLSKKLISRIQAEKKRAGFILPKKNAADHISFCWECYRKFCIYVTVDKRVDSVCNYCGWVQCPNCGACKDPKFGGCNHRVFY